MIYEVISGAAIGAMLGYVVARVIELRCLAGRARHMAASERDVIPTPPVANDDLGLPAVPVDSNPPKARPGTTPHAARTVGGERCPDCYGFDKTRRSLLPGTVTDECTTCGYVFR